MPTSNASRGRAAIAPQYDPGCAIAGGCDFPVSPSIDPPGAAVFWLPDDDTSVVVLSTTPEVLSPQPLPTPLDLDAGLRDEQGLHALLFSEQAERVQILAIGGPPFAAVIPLDRDGFARLDAVRRLLALLHGRRVPHAQHLTQQQRTRAGRMLRAFDAARDGATQQDIARVLFRLGPTSRDDWQASSLRHTIKALLRDARAMIAGGYRGLLRPRR